VREDLSLFDSLRYRDRESREAHRGSGCTSHGARPACTATSHSSWRLSQRAMACTQLPELLARTRLHHDVRELSADKAYSSVENHAVRDAFGVEAFIPFKVNAKVNPKAPVWSRHLYDFTLNQERFLPHYHRRSNVETVFGMIKARFGAPQSR
jgi:hypothetical protein